MLIISWRLNKLSAGEGECVAVPPSSLPTSCLTAPSPRSFISANVGENGLGADTN